MTELFSLWEIKKQTKGFMDEECNEPAMIIELDRRKDVAVSNHDLQREGTYRWVVIFQQEISYVSPALCKALYALFKSNEKTLFG